MTGCLDCGKDKHPGNPTEKVVNVLSNIGLMVQLENAVEESVVDSEMKRLHVCLECWKDYRGRI